MPFNLLLFIWTTEGPWPTYGGDGVQTVGEEKGPECTEKTARKKAEGGKEATRAGG